MKILFFHRWVGIRGGGTETHIRELAQRLSERGHEVHVLTLNGERLNNIPNIHIWTVSRGWGESPLSSTFGDPKSLIYTLLYVARVILKLLILRVRGIDFDVVSVHFATEAFLMKPLRAILGWPYVFVMEGYNDLEARVARWADGVIAISKDIVRRCESAVGLRPLHIPVGVDRLRFSPSIDGTELRSRLRKSGEKLVLCVCRLDPRKDLPTLITAMKEVCRKTEARLIIVGDGTQKGNLQRFIAKSGLSGKVLIDSQTVYDNLPKYYRAADVFALPTLYEGLGIAFLEAMSSGLPVVSTTAEAVPEIVGSAGLLVPPGDSFALAGAIVQVLTDSELRKSLVERGRRAVLSFEWEPLIVKYESVYQRVAKARG